MSSVIDDIANALVAAGLAQDGSDATDWRIREGYLQGAPDRSICVYAAGGRPPETQEPADYPTIQIRVRGKANDYDAVQQREAAIYALLHNCNAPAVLGANYTYCFALQSGPVPLGQDENRRPAIVRNYRVMVRRS